MSCCAPPGIVSLISLAVLSYERYCTMMASTIASNRDYRPVLGGICFSWFYSLAWTVPPLLGWSRYGPEGPGTTCSVDWRTQTPNNISYIVCLFTFCLLLPFCIILYSYGKLLHTVRQVSGAGTLSRPGPGWDGTAAFLFWVDRLIVLDQQTCCCTDISPSPWLRGEKDSLLPDIAKLMAAPGSGSGRSGVSNTGSVSGFLMKAKTHRLTPPNLHAPI